VLVFTSLTRKAIAVTHDKMYLVPNNVMLLQF